MSKTERQHQEIIVLRLPEIASSILEETIGERIKSCGTEDEMFSV